MTTYAELRQRHHDEFNALPLGFAFDDEQFEEMMRKWGLDFNKDLDKICRIPHGGFIQKKDLELLRQTVNRHDKEMQEAIAEDKTGNGFIYEMFYYELHNHEYGYTGDAEDTLDALGYTWEQIEADEHFKRGFEKATKKIMSEEDCF